MTIRSLANAALAAVFAPPCAACGQRIPRPLEGAVCDACWGALVPFTPPLCRSCGEPLPSWRVAALLAAACPRCRRGARTIRGQAAIGPYEGTLRAIVHALKYGGRRSVAPRLSALMAEAGRDLLDGAHAVVPVPLHARREWSRGFNQAELLARGLAPVRRLLTRVRATPPQVALPAARRHANVRDAFGLDHREASRLAGTRGDAPLAGRVIVLVDDVSTTGATLDACARVLQAYGAAEVRAITAARVACARPPSRLP